MRARLFADPGDVAFGYVAAPIDLDRVHAGGIVAGAKEDQAVAEDGPRDDGVTAVFDAPEFGPVVGVIGDDRVGAGADDLRLAIGSGDCERGAEGEALPRGVLAIGFPGGLAVGGVEGDDELFVAAVRGEDEFVAKKNRRPAIAVDGTVAILRGGPEDFALEVKASSPLMPEVDVDELAVGNRRWAGVAVLGMDLRCLGVAEKPWSATGFPPCRRRGRWLGAPGPSSLRSARRRSSRFGHRAR